ncbi:hypothetical protein ACFSKM_14610 [Ancylobacter dichloromethanicus]
MSMVQNWLIALGAGAASALLVATVATGSPLALPLFYLAPLPVLIVGLGWTHRAALIAASAAAVAIGVFFSASNCCSPMSPASAFPPMCWPISR